MSSSLSFSGSLLIFIHLFLFFSTPHQFLFICLRRPWPKGYRNSKALFQTIFKVITMINNERRLNFLPHLLFVREFSIQLQIDFLRDVGPSGLINYHQIFFFFNFCRCHSVCSAKAFDDVSFSSQTFLHLLSRRRRRRWIRCLVSASIRLSGCRKATRSYYSFAYMQLNFYARPSRKDASRLPLFQVQSGRYDTKDDFTVVLQPFMTSFNAPKDVSKRYQPFIDKSFITYDCFHFSQKGHALGKLRSCDARGLKHLHNFFN